MLPSYLKTPLIKAQPLSDFLGKNVYIKLESFQPTCSFKDRGIGNMCDKLAQKGSRGFVASSGGNAGMAVAYAAQRLNLPAHIFVPETTTQHMVDKLNATKAHITLHGNTWNETDTLARQQSEELSLDYIPPFDNPLLWEGYEPLVDEIKEQGINPDAWVLSVGGGGLLCGIIQALKKDPDWSNTPIITAETTGAASLATSMAQNKHVRLDSINTIAGTLGAKQVAKQAFDWSKDHPVLPQIVTDKQAAFACMQFLDEHKLMVEPACGATLSVLYEKLPCLESFDTLCVIACGGNGVSPSLLNSWKHQFGIG